MEPHKCKKVTEGSESGRMWGKLSLVEASLLVWKVKERGHQPRKFNRLYKLGKNTSSSLQFQQNAA